MLSLRIEGTVNSSNQVMKKGLFFSVGGKYNGQIQKCNK